MFNNSWFRKEKPLLGLTGLGGGTGSPLMAGAAGEPVSSSGGTKYTPGNGYVYHLFKFSDNGTPTGSLTCANNPGPGRVIEGRVCLVGGGGAGGSGESGGGLLYSNTDVEFSIGGTATPVTVGEGGDPAANNYSTSGESGGDSTVVFDEGTITVKGGGGGRAYPGTGNPGGCGGGAGGQGGPTGGTAVPGIPLSPFCTGNTPAFTNKGYAGGASGPNHGGGGGGGTGSVGKQGGTSGSPNGGAGDASGCPWIPGPLFSSQPGGWQSAVGPTGNFGGGGGGTSFDAGYGDAPYPGAGRGSSPYYGGGPPAVPGIDGTGGGGGGTCAGPGQSLGLAGTGGNGCVIIRYPTSYV